MKLKYVAIMCVIALLVLSVGCGKDEPGDNGGEVDDAQRFIGGDEGLVISFLDGAPPVETYDGAENNFGISVKVENEGESDVTVDQAILGLSGFLPADFDAIVPGEMEARLTSDLNGRDLDPSGSELPGGQDIIDYGEYAFVGEQSANNVYTIQADICYEYTTRAAAKLCFEDDLLDPDNPGSVCEANDQSISVEVSGAPVQLSSTMSESVAGSKKISFSFEVNKVDAEGELFSPEPAGEEGLCTEANVYEDTVYIAVDTGLGAGSVLSCTGFTGVADPEDVGEGKDAGYLKLFSGTRSVTCTLDIPEESMGDFTKEVTVALTYDYRQYASTEILIRHLDEE